MGADSWPVAPQDSSSSSSSPAADRSSSPFGTGSRSKLTAFEAPTSPSRQDVKVVATSPSAPAPSSCPPSSPIRHIANSVEPKPPITEAAEPIEGIDYPLTLNLERGVALQFGRKAKRLALPLQELAIPVVLPKSAKNASRLHASMRVLESTKEGTSSPGDVTSGRVKTEIRVAGSNGMKIDGKRWSRGSVVIHDGPIGGKVHLSFWGWSAQVTVLASEMSQVEAMDKPSMSRMSSYSSVTASSHLAKTYSDDKDEDSMVADAQTSGTRTSPPSPAISVLSDLSSPAPASTPLRPTRAETLERELKLDLAGMIASAIVFSPRSTVGVDEIVRALLRDVGGMWSVLPGDTTAREDEVVEAWWPVVENVLLNEPFFGCIDNAGLKDAAGHALLPMYYYVPDSE